MKTDTSPNLGSLVLFRVSNCSLHFVSFMSHNKFVELLFRHSNFVVRNPCFYTKDALERVGTGLYLGPSSSVQHIGGCCEWNTATALTCFTTSVNLRKVNESASMYFSFEGLECKLHSIVVHLEERVQIGQS